MAREPLQNVFGKRVLVCDGAMGTQLFLRGLKPGVCGELWNIERPADVRAIHAAYVAAGCDLITTNTFGATSTMLSRHGLDKRVAEINEAGAKMAREAAGDKAWVLGDVGPFGDFLEPAGEMTVPELTEIFQEQIKGLRAGGADGIIIETMADPAEAIVATDVARAIGGDWPVIATFSFAISADGVFRTMMGLTPEQIVKAMVAAGVSAVGTNCGTGMSLADYLALAKELVAAAGNTPVIIQPNAGAPQQTESGIRYLATPADMADIVPTLMASVVKVIGGCCGTTPEHLKAMAAAVKA